MGKNNPEAQGPQEAPFIDNVRSAFIDAALAKEDEKELAQAKESFGIRDRGSAAWAAGKIAEAQNEIDRRKKQCELYISDAEKRLDRLKWLFWEQLKEWAVESGSWETLRAAANGNAVVSRRSGEAGDRRRGRTQALGTR